MRELMQKIPRHLRRMGILSVVCLLFTGMVVLWEQQMQRGLYDQQMAERWSATGQVSQISVFYAEDAMEGEGAFRGIEQQVESALTQASVTNENENARLWIDAVSCPGKVSLISDRTSVEVNAVGVSGEFFQFHPQKQISGGLLRADDMMQDGIVIDKETAWQLFGSYDVVGMQVMIGQVPHFITGVIERGQGRMDSAAGLEKSICYLSLESLENYGVVTGGFTYEIVMPNPIKNFALSAIQTAVGSDSGAVVVENTGRYSLLSLIKVLREFGIRSMSRQGIVYPYWENIARGYEDILAVTLLVKSVLLISPVLFVILVIHYLWKKKTWTVKSVLQQAQDKLYEAQAKRAKRN